MSKEGVDLRLDVPLNTWVLCDEQLLSQVLVNLVANALKFTTKGFVLVRIHRMENENNQSFDVTQPRSLSFEFSGETTTKQEKLCSLKHISQTRCLSRALNDHSLHNKNIQSRRKYGAFTKHSKVVPVQSQHSNLMSDKLVNRSQNMIQTPQQTFIFEICDTGPGISADKQGMLFQKFQQAGNHFGAGIGLMLSQKIVQSRGGCIDLESPSWEDTQSGIVFNGSKFQFSLNMCEVNPNSEVVREQTRNRSYECNANIKNTLRSVDEVEFISYLRGLRLLLLDDSLTNLKQLHHKFTKQPPFSQFQWTCELAQTAQKALDLFEETVTVSETSECKNATSQKLQKFNCPSPFSIVIVDSELSLDTGKFSDGREFICRIRQMENSTSGGREKFQKILVIFYSGHVDKEHQKSALAAGADIVWTKPLPSPSQMLQDILGNLPSLHFFPHQKRQIAFQSILGEQDLPKPNRDVHFPPKRTQIICSDDKSLKANFAAKTYTCNFA